MKFKLDFPIVKNPIDFDYSSEIISLGSCFSDEIAKKLKFAGFRVNDNPFGVLFHPITISNVILSSLREKQEVFMYQREDLFFSWDASSKIFAHSEEDLVQRIKTERTKLLDSLKTSKVLLITFGSSFQYFKEEVGVVGNCHKAPQSFFEKQLATVDEMFSVWQLTLENLKKINPKLKVFVTVSPVRHVKDGLIENTRSKARLVELSHLLVDSFKDVYYFPSYEILLDELRDYRFFTEDLIHPSQQAVEYIWECFQHAVMPVRTKELVNKVEKLKKSFLHQSLHPTSKATKLFLQKLEKQKEDLMKENENINWEL